MSSLTKKDVEDIIKKYVQPEDFLSKLKEANKKEDKDLVLKGFHLESDLADLIDQLAKLKGGKGIKSRIVNEALRESFIRNGYMKEKG